MNEDSMFISVGKERLHYLKWGSGKRLLLAFPGYGEVAEQYTRLAEFLGKDYTVLSFDLPHHGQSKWANDTVLTRKDLAVMVETLMTEYKADKVSLIGYSMGGRVCLSIVASLPARIDKVTLVATDGLEVNFYFWFFTRTWVGKKMFSNMLTKPQRYFTVMGWLKAMKLVDVSRYKFVMHFLESADSRYFLLRVWPAMRALMPKPVMLKQLIRQYRIPVSLFMGEYDKIMPPSIAEQFQQGLDTVQVHVLDKGHRIFDHENARQIAESLV